MNRSSPVAKWSIGSGIFLGFFDGFGSHEPFSLFVLAEDRRRGRDRGEPFVLGILPLPAALSRASKALAGSSFGSSGTSFPSKAYLRMLWRSRAARSELKLIVFSAASIRE
jgi:hypothetical protein